MADKEVAIKINVDADGGAKSLSELKKEFKETQKTLEGLTAGSKEYIKTLEKLGGIKDDIGDLNSEIKSFNPEGKVQAFGNVMGGVASGIQGAVGAMALFGIESEETQKMLLKVQAASAFADGIKGVVGMGDAFKVLGNIIKANPIMAFLTALLAIGTAAYALYNQLNGVSSATADLTKELEKQKKSTELLNRASTRQIDLLTAQGGSSREIIAVKEKLIAAQILEIQTNIKLHKSKLEDIKDNDSLMESMRKIESSIKRKLGLTIEANIAEAGVQVSKEKRAKEDLDAIAKQEEDLLDLQNTLKILSAEKVNIYKAEAKTKKETDDEKAKKETEGYRKAEAEYDIYWKNLKAIKDKADADERGTYETAREDYENLLKSKEALEEYYNQKTKAGRLQSLKEQFEAELLLLKNDQAAKDLLTLQYNDKVRAIQKENNIISFGEQRSELKLQLEADLLAVGDNEAAKLELKKKYSEEVKKLNIQEVNANLEIAQQSNDAMQGLSDLFFSVKMANMEKGSAAELKAAKQQFKVNKALAITNGIISTIQGVINALTAQSSLPEPYATILKVVSAVSVAAAGAANVAKISAQQFNPGTTSGGGGGATASLGSAGGGVALAPPSSGSTSLNADGTIKAAMGNNQPVVKAVVVETDITTSQKRVNTIEERASL